MTPDTIILATAGPSLNVEQVQSLGFPVCAVSTAIKVIPKPTVWLFHDEVRKENQYGEAGLYAGSDPAVLKITRDCDQNRKSVRHFKNVDFVKLNKANAQDITARFMDGRQPLLKQHGYSVLMAVQVFASLLRCRRIIFAGCDLKVEQGKPWHAYPRAVHPASRNKITDGLLIVYNTLKLWTPIAKAHGCEFMCLAPPGASRLLEFMPAYEPELVNAA